MIFAYILADDFDFVNEQMRIICVLRKNHKRLVKIKRLCYNEKNGESGER